MQLLPLRFHIKAGNWNYYHQRMESKNYSKIKEIVLEQYKNQCAYCGYVSINNKLVNKNFNYRDNAKENIIPACSICVQCVLLDGFGQDRQFGGTIIFLPELEQVQLAHLLRTVYAGFEKQASYKSRLADFMITIEERKEYVESILGKKSYEPEFFAQGLLDTFIDEKKLEHPIFKNLRFLPDKAKLKNEIPDFIRTYFNND
jgi:intracellular multiplication protein IcmJ